MVVAPSVASKASKVRLVLTDCDGVLTDATVYYGPQGEALKRFNFRDGMGMEILRLRAGISTGIITGEQSEIVKRRAEKLQIDELHLGVKDKASVLKSISARLGIGLDAIAYIGDDVNDLEVLKQVGLSACPQDAMAEVKAIVHYVCAHPGGQGAFRELAELILASR